MDHQQQQPDRQQILEIQRLRDRIKMLETDNASMHLKLSKTQKDVDQRLTEIEMQIGPEDQDESGMADEESSVFADEHLIGPTGVAIHSLTGSGSSSGNGDNGIVVGANGNITSITMVKEISGSFEDDDENNRESFI